MLEMYLEDLDLWGCPHIFLFFGIPDQTYVHLLVLMLGLEAKTTWSAGDLAVLDSLKPEQTTFAGRTI